MGRWDPGAHCHGCCHVVHTDLSAVPPHHPKVHSIEDQRDSHLQHPVWVDGEEEGHTCEHEQQDNVANDPKDIADLVDDEEPSIHNPVPARGMDNRKEMMAQIRGQRRINIEIKRALYNRLVKNSAPFL